MDKYQPTKGEIAQLMQQVSDHPLGKNFLVNGALDSVAATFGVHAFVVEAARESLNSAAQIAEPKLKRLQESAISK